MEKILLKDTLIQYYPAKIKTTKPLGSVTIEYILDSIKSPDPNIKEVFRNIANAEAVGDMETKAKLKQNNLYYFTMCVNLGERGVNRLSNGKSYKSYRCYDNIDKFTGICVLDFDHIEHSEEFRDYVFDNYNFVISGFVSPSKKGVKFLIRIPICESVEEFKEYYYGLGLVFDKYKGWDGSGQNCVLPLFLSIDQDIKVRYDADIFDKKGKKKEFYSSATNVDFEIKVEEGDKKRVLENCKKAFNSIVDNGHPQLRAACISLGGYVAGGYVTEFEAIEFADNMIISNGYLQKGVSGYKKTARQAINKGQSKPLKLNK